MTGPLNDPFIESYESRLPEAAYFLLFAESYGIDLARRSDWKVYWQAFRCGIVAEFELLRASRPEATAK